MAVENSNSMASARTELLAPAGNWDCARAAVENGADGIYFGLERFNARMRAGNFTTADLPKLMEFLHRRGVRGYVTFNILAFTDELADAKRYLRAIIAAGVDAAIVQDSGVCRLIRRLSPDFPIHASTQMSVSSVAGIEFAQELGCQRVILARECSVKEIEQIHSKIQNTKSKIELEVFIHGALCVAYSGQCLTSESLGGRSANRGECAQACRMPYQLVSDGQLVPLGDRRYLLSPQDLAGLELLPDLLRAGVHAFKIEGRLKSPEYVANITRIYRAAIDKLIQESPITSHQSPITPADRYDMEMSFSRGLHTGWFRGTDNQALVHARFGKKRGVLLGEVSCVQGECVLLKLQAPLKPGDGIVFDAGRPDEKEEGGRVYDVETRGTETLLGFGRGDIDFKRVHVGDKLWKTSDHELDRRLRQSFAGDQPHYQRPVTMELLGGVGQPLTLIVQDETGHVVRLASAMPLVAAQKRPLDTERLREQLGRLGGTPFALGELRNRLEGAVMLPVSELNRLRRDAAAQLEALRAQPKRWKLNECGVQNAECGTGKVPETQEAKLIVLVRSIAQLGAALRCGVETIYCEFEDPKKYRDAIQTFRAAHAALQTTHSEIFVAPPRITKPGDDWILKQVRSCNPDGYLVRNYDHLKFFTGCRCVGDFSLNVANPIAAGYFIKRFGLERVTASYDLDAAQLEALLRGAPPAWFEIVIHQHMPMFHMEHCVFCAFLTTGTDYTNCGRPCDQHDVRLRDRVGAEHPVRTDAGCRNTVFNALAQTGAEHVARLMELGARRFRVEFLNEPPSQVAQTIEKYRQLLAGRISGAQLWRELKLLNQLGVTRGPMG
ncbi:MAG: U32 family peptidase [Verrucomicrobia bacterium]|nr:U32 family peptidase [Verrucomicrobiota bacterium]